MALENPLRGCLPLSSGDTLSGACRRSAQAQARAESMGGAAAPHGDGVVVEEGPGMLEEVEEEADEGTPLYPGAPHATRVALDAAAATRCAVAAHWATQPGPALPHPAGHRRCRVGSISVHHT